MVNGVAQTGGHEIDVSPDPASLMPRCKASIILCVVCNFETTRCLHRRPATVSWPTGSCLRTARGYLARPAVFRIVPTVRQASTIEIKHDGTRALPLGVKPERTRSQRGPETMREYTKNIT